MSSIPHIEAKIAGDISGQVAVGSYIIQNNVDHGGIVVVAAPGETPVPRRRPPPVRLAGRAIDIVGRRAELAAIKDVMGPSTPVELYGPAGIGKTALLKSVIADYCRDSPDANVVYHCAVGEPPSDTLQFLFEAFYTCDVPFKPTDAQIRHALADTEGLLALDDVPVGRDQLGTILDAAPSATALTASAERGLWGAGHAVAVLGLAADDAVALLSRDLDRPLRPDEVAVAKAATAALSREPLAVVRLAALVRTVGNHLIQIAGNLDEASSPNDEVARQLASTLNDGERRVLDALVRVRGRTLTAEHLAQLTGLPDTQPCIDSLIKLRLAQAHSPRYSATGIVAGNDVAGDGGDVRSLAACLAASGDDPEAVVELAGAVLLAVESAVAEADWAGVLLLGRLAEPGLIVGLRWGAWREVLEAERTAAEALGDREAEAWALHQLGTRALCLDDPAQADALLARALELREALGDEPGAVATRQNLDLLRGLPPPAPNAPEPETPVPPPPGRTVRRGAVLLLAAAAAVLALLIALAVMRPSGAPEPGRLVAPGREADFGRQTVGSRGPLRAIQLVNRGSRALVGVRLLVDGPQGDEFGIGPTTCPAVVEPQAACTVQVDFAPTGPGLRRAVLRLDDDVRPLVQLVGDGVSAAPPVPMAHVDLTPLDFGAVALPGRTAPQSVAVENRGSASLVGVTVTADGESPQDFALMDGCSAATVPAGGACVVEIVFSPTAVGPRPARLVLGFPAAEAVVVELTGVGVAVPVVVGPVPSLVDLGTASPEDPGQSEEVIEEPPLVPASVSAEPVTLDFGRQVAGRSSAAQTVAMSTTGAVGAAVWRVEVSGEDADEFAVVADGCSGDGTALAIGCAVAVTFTPSSSGPRAAVLSVTSSSGASASVDLVGRGAPEQVPGPGMLVVLPPSLNFGTVVIAVAPVVSSVTVLNVGASPVMIQGVALEGSGDFRMAGGTCIADSVVELAPAALCEVLISFAPVAVGPRAGAVVIGATGSGEVTAGLAGIGAAPRDGQAIDGQPRQREGS